MGDLTYPKIETVFDRKEDFTVDTTKLRRAEFGLVSEWVLTEKVDGSNIRLIFTQELDETEHLGAVFGIRGRSDNAMIPPQLLDNLRALCEDRLKVVQAIMDDFGLQTFILYGEGYGPKIQSGGRYRDDQGFILFDVRANSGWLDEDQVSTTAERLGLDRVPTMRYATIEEAVSLCQPGFASQVAQEFDPSFLAEGVVAKTAVPLYDRRGERLMWKLKAKDFRAGKR